MKQKKKERKERKGKTKKREEKEGDKQGRKEEFKKKKGAKLNSICSSAAHRASRAAAWPYQFFNSNSHFDENFVP